MIAFRFVPAICVLTGVALVPTLIHSYSPPEHSDGRSTAAISTTLAGYSGVPGDRNPTWGARRFGSTDWTERVYRSGADEVQLTVVRSFDAKSLYHHPELAVAYGTNFHATETRTPEGRPDLPVHVLYPGSGSRALGLYLLHYDDAFVADPIRFQIRSALEMLFSRRKPLTLLFVLDPDGGSQGSPERTGAMGVLVAAADAFAVMGQTTRAAATRPSPSEPASRAVKVGGDENRADGRLVANVNVEIAN